MIASASASANPRMAIACSRPWASGRRAAPLREAAKIRPIPTPGPMAARPYPIMFAEPVTMIPFGLFLWVSRVVLRWCSSGGSVLVCQCAGDVHRVEQDEDVGLQELHQQLEE